MTSAITDLSIEKFADITVESVAELQSIHIVALSDAQMELVGGGTLDNFF
jgi:hypothetical protein